MKTLARLAVVLMIVATTAYAESPNTEAFYVTAASLNVRLAPDADGKLTNKLYLREKVDVFEVKDGWARISEYYDGAVEGVEGKVARWVSAQYLSTTQPPAPDQPKVKRDPRIQGIPEVGEYGATKRDVEILYAAAHYYLKTGKCKRIEYGDKSASKPNTYYLNFGGNKNHFFKPQDIPGLAN